MNFKIISEISAIEIIARGTGVRDRQRLNRQYGGGQRLRWRKLKGKAIVEYENGEVWRAEVHWYEAHGFGRVEEKVTDRIKRLS